MKGIEIVFNRYEDAKITAILNKVPISNYTIIADNSIIYDRNDTIEYNGVINYDDIIRMQDLYMIMNMSLYIGACTMHVEKIETYEDFLKSDCDIVIIIYDCIFYEIYLKNESHIYQILKNLDDMNAREISIKTNSTDTRTRMFA